MGGDVPTSTFSLLGNETRLRIVLELGDASEPGAFDVLGFSELQTQVGVRDNGNFNYHLRRLTGTFVERTEEGYRLALAGAYVYRALRTGPLVGSPDRDRLETDVPCPACGVSQEVEVDGGRGLLGCPDCGTVNYRYPLPAGGLEREGGPALARALRERTVSDASAMLRGFCPYCSGPVDADVGPDVEVFPGSGEDDRPDEFGVSLACEHCRWFVRVNAAGMLDSHPRVSAFLLDHGIDSYHQDPWREAAFTTDVRSEEPWSVHVHVAAGSETLSLEFDERLDARELDVGVTPRTVRREAATDESGTDGADGRPCVTGRGTGV